VLLKHLNSTFITSQRNCNKGFTLIEIIIGIVVLSISLSILSTLIIPAEEKSVDQVLQVKAAELGQSILNDISSRAFDENSDMTGGLIRCGEPDDGSNLCTREIDFGPDTGETNRSLFNDVDDFHLYEDHFNADNQNLHQGYTNFDILVEVTYVCLPNQVDYCVPMELDSHGFFINENGLLAKKITVTVTTPLGTAIKFATHKANY